MFSQIFIRSTTCRLNSTLCRRHFAILALLVILPPFAAKCVFSACLTLGVQSIRKMEKADGSRSGAEPGPFGVGSLFGSGPANPGHASQCGSAEFLRSDFGRIPSRGR